MITRDLRCAIANAAAAAGFDRPADPGLRKTGTPGQYAASVALTLGQDHRETAQGLAARLADEQWIARIEVTGPGYLTITVTPEALAAVPDTITSAGPACVTSNALAGLTVPAAPRGDPLTAPTWEEARAALAARLTARLAAAAGATVAELASPERFRLTLPPHPSSSEPPEPPTAASPATSGLASRAASPGEPAKPPPDAGPVPFPDAALPASPAARHFTNSDDGAGARIEGDGGVPPREMIADIAAAVAFSGRDAVTFTLARAIPGKPLRVDQEIIARHVIGNPAYAVRYAHARAASEVRWAATSSAADTIGSGHGGSPPREVTALLDALSWLPERVATAARRGRPDEFARYLEDLASVTVDILSSTSHPGSTAAPGSDRLSLAMAARTGLAAGLGLLGVSAPDRL